MVEPQVVDVRMTRLLMDGGSRINILYKDAFDKLKIRELELRPSDAPFHGVIPDRHMMSHGSTTLKVMFDGDRNFRTQRLSFEVVSFSDPNNSIIGRPCYTKFLVVPNYERLLQS